IPQDHDVAPAVGQHRWVNAQAKDLRLRLRKLGYCTAHIVAVYARESHSGGGQEGRDRRTAEFKRNDGPEAHTRVVLESLKGTNHTLDRTEALFKHPILGQLLWPRPHIRLASADAGHRGRPNIASELARFYELCRAAVLYRRQQHVDC